MDLKKALGFSLAPSSVENDGASSPPSVAALARPSIPVQIREANYDDGGAARLFQPTAIEPMSPPLPRIEGYLPDVIGAGTGQPGENRPEASSELDESDDDPPDEDDDGVDYDSKEDDDEEEDRDEEDDDEEPDGAAEGDPDDEELGEDGPDYESANGDDESDQAEPNDEASDISPPDPDSDNRPNAEEPTDELDEESEHGGGEAKEESGEGDSDEDDSDEDDSDEDDSDEDDSDEDDSDEDDSDEDDSDEGDSDEDDSDEDDSGEDDDDPEPQAADSPAVDRDRQPPGSAHGQADESEVESVAGLVRPLPLAGTTRWLRKHLPLVAAALASTTTAALLILWLLPSPVAPPPSPPDAAATPAAAAPAAGREVHRAGTEADAPEAEDEDEPPAGEDPWKDARRLPPGPCARQLEPRRIRDHIPRGFQLATLPVPDSVMVYLGASEDGMTALGLELNATTLESREVFRDLSKRALLGVVPRFDGDKVAFRVDRVSIGGHREWRSLPGPLDLALTRTNYGVHLIRQKDYRAVHLWPVDAGDELTRAEVERYAQKRYGVVFRRGGLSGDIVIGWVDGRTLRRSSLSELPFPGRDVGEPSLAIRDGRALVAAATRLDDKTPWTARLATARWRRPSREVEVPALTPTGAADRAEPKVVALSGGRWLVQWTEGKPGKTRVRALTLDESFAPLGKSIEVSPADLRARGGRLAVVDQGLLSLFLVEGAGGLELWGTGLACD